MQGLKVTTLNQPGRSLEEQVTDEAPRATDETFLLAAEELTTTIVQWSGFYVTSPYLCKIFWFLLFKYFSQCICDGSSMLLFACISIKLRVSCDPHQALPTTFTLGVSGSIESAQSTMVFLLHQLCLISYILAKHMTECLTFLGSRSLSGQDES